MQPAAHLDPRTLKSAPGRVHVNPLLLLCHEMIQKAFRCACATRDGVPTADALDSVDWLTCDLDWTHTKGPIPPPLLREEFYLSFQHCCQGLSLDPDQVRREGLPRDVAILVNDKHKLRTRVRVDHGHNCRAHVAGLGAVYESWEAAAKRHTDQQHSDSAVETEAMCAGV